MNSPRSRLEAVEQKLDAASKPKRLTPPPPRTDLKAFGSTDPQKLVRRRARFTSAGLVPPVDLPF